MIHSVIQFGPQIDLGRQCFLLFHQRNTRELWCEPQHVECRSVQNMVRNNARETVSTSKHVGAY
jgi:hypothetical protein